LTSKWPADEPSFIAAGYTYFGQFLAHELVPSRNGIIRSPLLELESVYGGTTGRKPLIDEFGKFLLGVTHPMPGFPSRALDLPRLNKIAWIPEPRNDENLLVAQLHLLFLRFHNVVTDRLRQELRFSRAAVDTVLEYARRIVVHVVQEITLNEFLYAIVGGTQHRLLREEPLIRIAPADSQLPKEFTSAAFRF